MDIITLLKVLVSGLLNAQTEFLEHLDQFSTFEETVNRLTDQIAADSIRSNEQIITKTTVMNKVHSIEKELPQVREIPVEKKACGYLYIEADEDHIHRQQAGKEQGCFMGKLIYLFEEKEEACKGRRKLIAPFYFGGLYAGTE